MAHHRGLLSDPPDRLNSQRKAKAIVNSHGRNRNFLRGYFSFSTEERKNSSDLSFDSSEVSFDSSEVSFDSSEEIIRAYVESFCFPRSYWEISTEGDQRLEVRE